MRVAWVVATNHAVGADTNLDAIKAIGPIWGSHETWRAWSTDNVVCHDRTRARELLDRAFQAVCNFYLPRTQYEFLQRPIGVKLYEGDFSMEVDAIDDIVSLHLAAAQSDIVLMLGFDLGPLESTTDRLAAHKWRNRHGLMRGLIANSGQTQWVVVNPAGDLDKAYQTLPNLTCDTMANALQLLA